MGKQLNLVYVQQSGTVIQFYNKVDGFCVAMIELSRRATYTENTTYIFSVAEAVEQFIAEPVDRAIAVNAAHRALTVVKVVNVTGIENKIGAAVEDYLKVIGKRLKNTKNTNYQIGRNPKVKDYGAFRSRQG